MTTYFKTTELSRRFRRADVGKRQKQKRSRASLAYLDFDFGLTELIHPFPLGGNVSSEGCRGIFLTGDENCRVFFVNLL
jgi:hypothetical protein